METNHAMPLEHQNVPLEHQGLHSFLYSSDDEHTAMAPAIAEAEMPTKAAVPLADWCEVAGNAKIAGVYAVLSGDRQTQYIGYSRNVALSLRGHLTQFGNNTCAFVQVQPFKFPKRDEMEALRDAWIAELDSIPPGNLEPSAGWAATIGAVATAVMSATERQAYDEKKLKLRKAMAEAELSRELPAESDASATQATRQKHLEAAVTQDDWSGVVQQQTQETLSD